MQPPTHPVPEGFICSPITYSGCIIKRGVDIPVIAVNEIRTEEQVRFLIENDYVDLVAVGRGMLADPEFANHVINSEPVITCSACKGCFWFTDDTLCPARSEE
jgi:2,4-dienoyl-CoA reductase-like NADH-dependent reductase (Old Yellow Enzyme family)